MSEPIPTLIAKFGAQKRWVNWVSEEKDGKMTKIPIGSSTDPKTWSTYANLPNHDKVGLMFGLKKLLLGVDIDKCLVDGKLDEANPLSVKIKIFGVQAETYCEVSPSGTGLHFFLELTEPLDLIANRKGGIECYTTGRYFTVTHNPFSVNRPVRKVTPARAIELLQILGYPWEKKLSPVRKNGNEAAVITLDDKTIIEKMFKGKNGAKIKALYNGDISAHGTDDSAADMAFLSHLCFYTAGNADQMERIWLASPLGARAKTQERKDYRDRTIQAALATVTEFYKPSPKLVSTVVADKLELDLLFTLNQKGEKIFTQNTENMCRVLRRHPDFVGTLRFDNFKNVYEIKEGGRWRELQDVDAVRIQSKIAILFSFFQKVGKDMIYDAMTAVAKENEIDSAIDYVSALVWDKKPRLDKWLTNVYGAPEDEYHRSVGANWLKGLVKRIVEPGCKFDHVLVLEGEQGTKKSTSLAILGGDWHIETTMSTDSKDFFMQFLGNVIVEFSEGETLSRTEVKRMKAIITTQYDKYRQPYERMTKNFPRRCVFAMTTNQEEYLKDETGNRRWLPVKLMLPNADVDWLKANRDQLFAEAYHRVVNLKETTHEFPDDETKLQQARRKIQDPNTDTVEYWYYNALTDTQRKAGVTVRQVFQEALENRGSIKMNHWDYSSIGGILRDYLRLEKVQNMRNGIRAVRWYQDKKDADLDIAPYEKYPQELINNFNKYDGGE